MKRMLFTLVALAIFAGCQQQQQQERVKSEPQSAPTVKATTPASGKTIFSEPLKAIKVERPSEALPYWRDAAGGSKPALLIFSQHPFLQPLGEGQTETIRKLIATGDAVDFAQRGSFYRPAPALVPTQALSAALAGGLFSEIVWVFPTRSAPEDLSLETMRTQLLEAQFLSPEESQALQLEDGIFSTTLRDIPFRIVHPMAIPELAAPAALHIDLSYFKGLYKNEIKTPLYPTLRQQVETLRGLKWQVQAVTLSYSTEEAEISLETRFLINRLADLLGNPTLLEKDMPQSWALHSEALYAINFFLEDKVTELYQRAVDSDPNDPAVLHGLAQRRLRDNKLEPVLALIERAAKQDNGYAAEYLNLAAKAGKANDLATAEQLLAKGAVHFPLNPFISIERADLLIKMGKTAEARSLIRELQKLPWSASAHPQIPGMLAAMLVAEPPDSQIAAPSPGDGQ